MGRHYEFSLMPYNEACGREEYIRNTIVDSKRYGEISNRES